METTAGGSGSLLFRLADGDDQDFLDAGWLHRRKDFDELKKADVLFHDFDDGPDQ
jgi:hypothetical protein